jgi:hypothetical protein
VVLYSLCPLLHHTIPVASSIAVQIVATILKLIAQLGKKTKCLYMYYVLYFVFEIRVFPFLEAGCSADSTTQQYATCTRVRTCSLKIVLVIR